jgi:transcriptional regulator with XRE-family HTH domain
LAYAKKIQYEGELTMSIYFSEKFKQLRKNSDLTQEQTAEIFHVSPQSVSRWETGVNYPDIELLPHIAGFFKVTVDELLGTEAIKSEEKIAKYTKDIRNLLNSGKLDDAIATARKAVKEYPLNTVLHYHFVQAMSAACSEQTPGYEENTKKLKGEIIAVSERIINLSDYKSSLSHRVQLIRQYAKWGMKEEAKKVLDTLPSEIWDTQEPWLGLVMDGEKWRENQQHRIIRAKYLLEYLIREYITQADLDISQKLEYKKIKMRIEMLIDTISGEKIEPIGLAFEHIGIAELYCKKGDIENALDYVEKATQNSMHHIEQMDKTNEDDGGNYMAWSTPRNLPWLLWEDHLTNQVFDPVRNNERFVKCFELLKANSRELKQTE